jgi:site-specific recombinase XerD
MTRLELDPWLEGYLSYLSDVRRLQHRTVVDVRCTLKKVGEFMSAARPGVPLWKLTLDDYLHWLSEQRQQGRAENALAKELSHLRGLLDYAWRSGRSDRNALDGFSLQDSLQKTPPETLTLEEARRLVQRCPRSTPQERRRRIVVLLLYGCGLRTSELCSLDVRDVNVERQEILVRKGKGGRQRTIPVPAAVWTELLAYLTERGGKRGPLFQTLIRRKRIVPKEVGEIVRDAALRASIERKVTPRTLRHAFGTHLMDAGVDLGVIASLMGHRTPNETGVYLHVLPGKMKEAVDSLSEEEGDKS